MNPEKTMRAIRTNYESIRLHSNNRKTVQFLKQPSLIARALRKKYSGTNLGSNFVRRWNILYILAARITSRV